MDHSNVAQSEVRTHVGWDGAWHGLWTVVALFVCAAGYQVALVFDIISWGRRGQLPPARRVLTRRAQSSHVHPGVR